MMSGGSRSGRVESSCPNFRNVGPGSSSIAPRGPPPRRRSAPDQLAAAQPPVVEEVAEAVAGRDLRDLRQAAEVAWRGRRHGKSVTGDRAVTFWALRAISLT